MSFVEIGLESQADSIIRQIESRTIELINLQNQPLTTRCDRSCRNALTESKRNELDILQERLNTVQDEIIFVDIPTSETIISTLQNNRGLVIAALIVVGAFVVLR